MHPEMIINIERMCCRMIGDIAAKQVNTLFELHGHTETACFSLKEELTGPTAPGRVDFTIEMSLVFYNAPGGIKKYPLVTYGFFDNRTDPIITRITRQADGAEIWTADGVNDIGKIELG